VWETVVFYSFVPSICATIANAADFHVILAEFGPHKTHESLGDTTTVALAQPLKDGIFRHRRREVFLRQWAAKARR
jgi:hypothetical protein